MSIARDLARLRTPVQPVHGGIPLDYLSGFDWYITEDNTVTVLPGTLKLPNGEIVTMANNKIINMPTSSAGIVRNQLWVFNNNGVADVMYDSTSLGSTYSGNAYKHSTLANHRYIGSVQLGTGLNPVRQRCVGNRVLYMGNINDNPNILFSGTVGTTGVGQSTDVICPGSMTAINMQVFNNTTNLSTRFSASVAACGYNTTGALFAVAVQGNAQSGTSGNIELAVGEDRRFQIAGTISGTAVVQCTGYTFRR